MSYRARLLEWAPVGSRRANAMLSRPARRPGSGACQDTRPFNKHCATATSTPSASPSLCFCPSLTRSNRHGRDPRGRLVQIHPASGLGAEMPGGVGGAALRGVPLSRSTALLSRQRDVPPRRVLLARSPLQAGDKPAYCRTPLLTALLATTVADQGATRRKPTSINTVVRKRRRARGARDAITLPSAIPVNEPISSEASRERSTVPTAK